MNIWKNIPWQACSGDEMDTRSKPYCYVITNLGWRAREVRPWMQVLDDLHLLTRFHPGQRRTAGNLPHDRLVSGQRDERGFSAPVKGLPRNFYDAEWLEDLDEHQKRDLQLKPAVDMTFPKRIIEYINILNSLCTLAYTGHQNDKFTYCCSW